MGVRGDERKKAGGCLARERQVPLHVSRKNPRGRERRERVAVWCLGGGKSGEVERVSERMIE
ncbi:hypothetical protein D8674_029412 [Pyrus ussuriensis x Pyrus communis]|uniref:Uncharacterized protein n=1 Tax=Pyrus ussuriensis x Pyrus communis TaxID=2448454 RepID=A0A5N5HYZ0_9ROSA|nr:hypothetical protein D8674_041521 [Pyrus ussuriensis x Pyrus communis]KAB2633165.1 hypothetical protein D8674_029412 [Pyrus ussuriensis x Pyrus communis]